MVSRWPSFTRTSCCLPRPVEYVIHNTLRVFGAGSPPRMSLLTLIKRRPSRTIALTRSVTSRRWLPAPYVALMIFSEANSPPPPPPPPILTLLLLLLSPQPPFHPPRP